VSGDFDDFIIVSSSNKKVAADVKKALRKKIEQEHKEAEPQKVWGRDEGYCAWCVNRKVSDPIWEEGTDSQGDHVKYACCKECAVDRGVIEEGRTCENTKHYRVPARTPSTIRSGSMRTSSLDPSATAGTALRTPMRNR